jgi:hypothetical protein
LCIHAVIMQRGCDTQPAGPPAPTPTARAGRSPR